MTPFNKPQTTIEEHIDRLKSRGMSFFDEQAAAKTLSHIGYYRLSAYWLPYEDDHSTHKLKLSTQFEDILRDYNFDRTLRLLVLDAIERIEISIKARWTYEFINDNGNPHSHLDGALFTEKYKKNGDLVWSHQKGVENLKNEIGRSEEPWVRHFRQKYDEETPPLWACCDLMSFGSFTKWYRFTKSSGTRNKVARSYGLDERFLVSFLHHAATVRNICAHHGRLWNRSFTFTYQIPKNPVPLGQSLNASENRKIYNTLTMLSFLVHIISPDSQWHSKLIEQIENSNISIDLMGFPENYRKTPVWAKP